MAEPQSVTRDSPFELIAGNVSLDFVNTLDDRPSSDPKELLRDYSSLARFAQQAGILTSRQREHLSFRISGNRPRAEQALRRARALREALHEILSAFMAEQPAPQSAVDALNAELHDAALHSRLVATKTAKGDGALDRRLEWRFDDLSSSFNAILWPIARAAADLLASGDVALVRACSSPTCQWFFLDTSKNHHRRWCSMKLCGNRAKVRKFYARKKTA